MTYYYNGEIKWDGSGEEMIFCIPGFKEMSINNEMGNYKLWRFMDIIEKKYSYELADIEKDGKDIPVSLDKEKGKEAYEEQIMDHIFTMGWKIKEILEVREPIQLIIALDTEYEDERADELERINQEVEEHEKKEQSIPIQLKGIVHYDEMEEKDCFLKYGEIWRERINEKYVSESRREEIYDLLMQEVISVKKNQ